MSKGIWVVALVCVCALVVFSGLQPVRADAPLFVVYGTILNGIGGAPVDGGYVVTVKNLDKEIAHEMELGSGPDAGKFCAVFMDHTGGSVVSVGDEIMISARLQYLQDGRPELMPTGTLEAYTVTAADVEYMKKYIEVVIEVISVESRSWGAIKALYRE